MQLWALGPFASQLWFNLLGLQLQHRSNDLHPATRACAFPPLPCSTSHAVCRAVLQTGLGKRFILKITLLCYLLSLMHKAGANAENCSDAFTASERLPPAHGARERPDETVCALGNEGCIITHLHKRCLGNFNPGFPNFLSTRVHSHYKVFMQAFCVWYVFSFKVSWSIRRMSKGGDSYLGNAKEWKKNVCSLLFMQEYLEIEFGTITSRGSPLAEACC